MPKYKIDGLKPKTLRELLVGADMLIDFFTATNNGMVLGLKLLRERLPEPYANDLTDLTNEWSSGLNNIITEYDAAVARILGRSPNASEAKQ